MHHINSNSMNTQASEDISSSSPPQLRGRNNSAKSKLLVRSHAMREEASPPREPTPTPQQHPPPCLKGPLLTLPSSRNHSPIHPCVVVSPSHLNSNDPSTTICISPTATLTPPPVSKHSPRNLSPHNDHSEFYYEEDVIALKPSRVNGRHDRREDHRTDVVIGEVEQDLMYRRNGRLRVECGCGNTVQCCSKCLRNFNNNLNSTVYLNSNNNGNNSFNNSAGKGLLVNRVGSRGSLRQQSSSQGSFDSNNTSSPRLSRDNSAEIYTDTTGVNLVRFISETLNKNMKDRQLLLRIEQELLTLCDCTEKTHYKFPAMSSYQRMLVHRVAAYFGMEHNIEPSGKSVVVNKTKNTRIPEVRFETYIRDDIGFSEEPRRSILKRDSNSIEDYNFKSPDRQSSFENRRSKSIEEREEEYNRARRRIFNNKEMRDCGGSTDDLGWHDQSWSSIETEAFSSFRLQPPDHHFRSNNRLYKVHSEETHEETLRPQVAKSYSFGGYAGAHCRSEIINSPRLLTKQDSGASSSRLSPSSSGYKTQSQRSGSITPSPTSISYYSGDSLRQDSMASVGTNTSEQASPSCEQQEVVWVRCSVSEVPKGKEVIDPNTLETARNPDGSIYKFDPDNVLPNVVIHSQHKSDETRHEDKPEETEDVEEEQAVALPLTEELSSKDTCNACGLTNDSETVMAIRPSATDRAAAVSSTPEQNLQDNNCGIQLPQQSRQHNNQACPPDQNGYAPITNYAPYADIPIMQMSANEHAQYAICENLPPVPAAPTHWGTATGQIMQKNAPPCLIYGPPSDTPLEPPPTTPVSSMEQIMHQQVLLAPAPVGHQQQMYGSNIMLGTMVYHHRQPYQQYVPQQLFNTFQSPPHPGMFQPSLHTGLVQGHSFNSAYGANEYNVVNRFGQICLVQNDPLTANTYDLMPRRNVFNSPEITAPPSERESPVVICDYRGQAHPGHTQAMTMHTLPRNGRPQCRQMNDATTLNNHTANMRSGHALTPVVAPCMGPSVSNFSVPPPALPQSPFTPPVENRFEPSREQPNANRQASRYQNNGNKYRHRRQR